MKQLWGCVVGLACLVGSAATAQSLEPVVTGTWIGGLESDGQFEFYAATIEDMGSLAGTATVPMRGLSGPLRSLSLEGNRIRVAGPASLILSGIVSGDVITGDFEAQRGRSRGRFRLSRIPTVKNDQLSHYQGAYRFSDGAMLLVDRAEIDAVSIPSALTITDVTTGSVRIVFLRSGATFVAGPSILVPQPADFTLSFRVSGNRVTGLTQTPRIGTSAEAVRLDTSEQEVRFRNGNVELAGTLLLPSVRERHPAIVLTHGGGPAVRAWHWGFGYLLASRGFAVLAYDKRGAGQSSGEWRDASKEDLADDAVAAARFLQGRTDIDGARIGFWGASQGGWIAPLSAVRFGTAAFVITLSGGGLTPAQQELLDSEWELTNAGFSQTEIREAISFQKVRDEFARTGSGWEQYAAQRGPAVQTGALWYGFLGTDLSGPARADSPEWNRMRRSYFYDPAPTLRALRAPILSIFGSLDTPQGVELNVKAMNAALSESGHTDFTIRVFRNGRHNLLMDMSGAASTEFARLDRFVPGLFESMASWLVQRAQPK